MKHYNNNTTLFGLGPVVAFLAKEYGGFLERKYTKQLFREHHVSMLKMHDIAKNAESFIEHNFMQEVKDLPNWKKGLSDFFKPYFFNKELSRLLQRSHISFNKKTQCLSLNFDAHKGYLAKHHKLFLIATLGAILDHYARIDSQVIESDFKINWVGSNLDYFLEAALSYHSGGYGIPINIDYDVNKKIPEYVDSMSI